MNKEQLYAKLDNEWNTLAEKQVKLMDVDYEYDDSLCVTASVVMKDNITFEEFARNNDLFLIELDNPCNKNTEVSCCDDVIQEIVENFELGETDVTLKLTVIHPNKEKSIVALYNVERCIPRYDGKSAILVCKFDRCVSPVQNTEESDDKSPVVVSDSWKSIFDEPFFTGRFAFPNFSGDFEKAVSDFESNVSKFFDDKVQDSNSSSFAMMVSRDKDGVTKVMKSKNGEKPTVEMFDKNGDKLPCALNGGDNMDDCNTITTPSTDKKPSPHSTDNNPSPARSAIEKFKKILG